MKNIIHNLKKALSDPALIFLKQWGAEYASLDLGDEFPIEDAIALATVASLKINKGAKVLEIGSWKGRSSIILGLICKKKGAKLTCVDTWNGSSSVQHQVNEAEKKDIYTIFIKNIKTFFLEKTITSYRLKSDSFFEISENEYDFIFIDGNHAYSQFTKDLKNSIRFLSRNGYICGHDCEYKFDQLPESDQRKILTNLETDYIQSNDTSINCGLHPGVIYGLWSVFGGNTFSLRSTHKAGLGIWFVQQLNIPANYLIDKFHRNLVEAALIVKERKLVETFPCMNEYIKKQFK